MNRPDHANHAWCLSFNSNQTLALFLNQAEQEEHTQMLSAKAHSDPEAQL